MICNYCGRSAEWVENKEIYGANYGKSYMVWLCRKCGAYVGCHNNTKTPLGTMANRALRECRIKAKSMFISKLMNGDWKNKKLRSYAYGFINKIMEKEFHFGESTIEDCNKIINILSKVEIYDKRKGSV